MLMYRSVDGEWLVSHDAGRPFRTRREARKRLQQMHRSIKYQIVKFTGAPERRKRKPKPIQLAFDREDGKK